MAYVPGGVTQYSFAQIRAILATFYARYANEPAADTEGEPLDAFLNSMSTFAGQQNAQVVLAALASRLKTCVGFDVDSFINAFGVIRPPGVQAQGTINVTTPLLTQNFTVPFGTIFGSSVSGVLYVAIADPSQPTYTPSGYVFLSGSTGGPMTVQCTQEGTVGNAAPGAINQTVQGPSGGPAVSGIISVSNPQQFVNGADEASDSEAMVLFATKVTSGNVATAAAILAAVLAIQANLTVSYGDQMTPNGSPAPPATYSLIVNILGQSGPPPDSLITAVQNAISVVRSASDVVYVAKPALAIATITGGLLLVDGADPVATVTDAENAAVAYVNSVGMDMMGNPSVLSPARLAQAILKAVPNVADVISLLLDGQEGPLIAPFGTQIVANAATFVSVSPAGLVV